MQVGTSQPGRQMRVCQLAGREASHPAGIIHPVLAQVSKALPLITTSSTAQASHAQHYQPAKALQVLTAAEERPQLNRPYVIMLSLLVHRQAPKPGCLGSCPQALDHVAEQAALQARRSLAEPCLVLASAASQALSALAPAQTGLAMCTRKVAGSCCMTSASARACLPCLLIIGATTWAWLCSSTSALPHSEDASACNSRH